LLATVLFALGGARAAFFGVGAILPLVALSAGGRLLDIDRHATAPVVEVALLRSVPMLALLPPPTLESLARALIPVDVPAHVDVITQGDEGDRFYVIADGEVEVIADGTLVATLHRGDGFGEIALMYDVPRTATVHTCSDVRLYALEREDFLVALTGHLPAQTLAQGLASERLADLEALRASRAPV
jgi:CRP-like cAMP-binding protein